MNIPALMADAAFSAAKVVTVDVHEIERGDRLEIVPLRLPAASQQRLEGLPVRAVAGLQPGQRPILLLRQLHRASPSSVIDPAGP